jgi:chromosome segregation protein
MRVSRLTILGFKSFAEKIDLAFGPGITALVGPNGCGKTNVVEALRWVLGEQNPRALRCGRMDEVIFAGSAARKPLGMAEVVINLEDDGGGLPGGAAELEVSRRLFKDGQSDYVINRQPVLLRDVRDVFMDIGFGTEGYSLLEREMVDQVLKDPSGTRRLILEQAAGIARYRDRSRRATVKLEATRQDMLRLSDLLGEVKTQVISLARQAGRAERYREYQQEIRKLSTSLLALENERLCDKGRSLKQQTERAEQKRRKAMQRLQESERSLRDVGQVRTAMEQQLAQGKQDADALQRQKADGERQERFLSEQLAEARHGATSFQEREKREKDRLTRTQRQSLELARQGAELRREARSCEEQAERVRTDLDAVRRQRGELAPRIVGLDRTIRDEREQALSRQRERGELAERHRLTGQQLERLNERERRAEERLRELGTRRDTLASDLTGARAAVRELEACLEASRGELDTAEKAVSALVRDSAATASRIEFLRALREEGTTPFESLLERDGVVGCIGQLVSVDAGWELPVNGALGEAAEWLVVRTWSDAIGIAGLASELPRGRILVLEGFLRWLEDQPGPRSGAVAEHVSGAREIEPLLGHLLGQTAVVGDLGEARRLVEDASWPRVVTKAGEVIEAPGAVGVGQLRAVVGSEHRLADEERQLEELEQARTVADRRVADLRSRCDELQRTLEQERARQIVLRAETERVADESAELVELRDQLGADRAALEREMSSLEAPTVGDEPLPDMSELDALREQDGALAAEESEHRSQLAELERRSAGLHGRLQGIAGELRRLAVLRGEARGMAADAAAEATRCTKRVAELSRELEALHAQLEDVNSRLMPLTEKVARDEAELGRIGEQVETWEHARAEAWERLEQSRESLHTVEIEQARLDATHDALKERASRELGCSLEQLGAPEVPGSAEELGRRIAELTERKEAMGSVNFAAEQEHVQAKERYDFLDAQLKDLIEARDALEEAMERMKETAKQLFVATLEQVRANFRYTFGELFHGGEADLRLLDEDDPLESGVDIVACPGGKRLRRIEVLSGGERALTAIALLFAIYLVRPSPFCILDEVDAPLDDANVDRFLGVLSNFASGSQFVIVTHNRRTMKAADALYGITMAEPGVSQVVSVKLPEGAE